MNKIYLSVWTFHEIQKVNPKQKSKPPQTIVIKDVLVKGSDSDVIKNDPFYIRRALRSARIKDFENYKVIKIEFIREIHGISANDGIGKNKI